MNAGKLVGIALIAAGVLGLVYGSFSYTKETHETKLGPLELSVKDKETVSVPTWAGVGGDRGGRRAAAARRQEGLVARAGAASPPAAPALDTSGGARVLEESARSFIPAAGRDWLLPLYDPLQWLLGGDALKRPLVEQAALAPGLRVLDIGCGTGSLTLLIKRLHPEVEVAGLDPDPKALAIAKRKAERAGLAIQFERGFSDPLPYPDACFERVFSSLMFHHLTQDEKTATLREVRRVLAPGGSLHLLDFGPPRSGFARAAAHVLHRAGHCTTTSRGSHPGFARAGGIRTHGRGCSSGHFRGKLVVLPGGESWTGVGGGHRLTSR